MFLLRLGIVALLVTTGGFISTRAAAAQTNLLFGITNEWRYWQAGSLDASNWTAFDFDDSSWASGPALLFVETAPLPAPKNTPLTLGAATYYFRTHFTATSAPPDSVLVFSNLIDDGAVFYLNGVEIQRLGMPAGPVVYETLSSRVVGDASAYDVFGLSGDTLTNLVNGDNVLAVEVHQQATNSSDIVLGSAASLVSGISARVTRGPYLQSASPTSLVVRWRTDVATGGRVRFGTNLAELISQADVNTASTEHEVNLTGLRPNTKYFYAVGTVSTNLAGGDTNHFFTTPPIPGTRKPTRIWVIGDSGTGNANQINVRNAYEKFTAGRDTDLWLMLGDNAYDSGTDREYQTAVFNIYANLLRKTVLWSTLGNHETAQATAFTDNYPYFNIFTFPKNGEAGGLASGTEHYYSFNYANIHFVCLDSMTANRATNGAMATWLTNDLADVTADWIIAFWHHPPYSKGSHNSDAEIELIQMRRNFLPILEAYGVDLVLSGHSHCYERSFLLDSHYGQSSTLSTTNKLNAGSGRESGSGVYTKPAGGPASHQGAVYAVVGSSGQISGGSLNHPAMYISLNNLGSLVLDISGNRLDAKFIRENGTTNDFFTIQKLNDPPNPPVLIAPLDCAVEVPTPPELTVNVSDPETNDLAVTFYGREGTTTNPFAVLGTVAGVPSGNNASLAWTNLARGTLYEWQVSVSDGTNIVSGPIWHFTSTTNYPPSANNLAALIHADTPRPLKLHGSDPEDAVLTYQLFSLPGHGLITGFDPIKGKCTYTAAHGYAGPDHFIFRVFDGLMFSEPATFSLNVFNPPDVLPNGVSAGWMTKHGLTNPDGDEDRDGVGNAAEYWANTDPRDAGSSLRILSARMDEQRRFILTWTSVGGTRYRISRVEPDANGDLGGGFQSIERSAAEEIDPTPLGQPSTQSFTDDGAAMARFYRVEVVQ
ncbi:MAG: metallophosphoesterase [Verrucomicrobia bacterium]|nr:metallophosphoesterase [Verrucomicrobiota bacterium]